MGITLAQIICLALKDHFENLGVVHMFNLAMFNCKQYSLVIITDSLGFFLQGDLTARQLIDLFLLLIETDICIDVPTMIWPQQIQGKS